MLHRARRSRRALCAAAREYEYAYPLYMYCVHVLCTCTVYMYCVQVLCTSAREYRARRSDNKSFAQPPRGDRAASAHTAKGAEDFPLPPARNSYTSCIHVQSEIFSLPRGVQVGQPVRPRSSQRPGRGAGRVFAIKCSSQRPGRGAGRVFAIKCSSQRPGRRSVLKRRVSQTGVSGVVAAGGRVS